MNRDAEKNSLERQYKIAHRNALDKQFQTILSEGEKNISHHIIDGTMEALFSLFEEYRQLDGEISNLYFKYTEPKPLFGSSEEYFSTTYRDVDDEDDDMTPPADTVFHNPHEALFLKIKNKFPDGLLKAQAGGVILHIDDDILGSDRDEPGNFFHIIPAGGTAAQSIPLYEVYPQDAEITERVRQMMQNQKSAIRSLFIDVEQEIRQYITNYNSIQQVTQNRGFADLYRPVSPFRNGGLVRVTAKQQDFLQKLATRSRRLTPEEKEALSWITQYMTLSEASTIIDRLVQENKTDAEIALGKTHLDQLKKIEPFGGRDNGLDKLRDEDPDFPF